MDVLSTGKGRNKLLLECARAAWMVQATVGIEISFVHVPGKENDIADCLSKGPPLISRPPPH